MSGLDLMQMLFSDGSWAIPCRKCTKHKEIGKYINIYSFFYTDLYKHGYENVPDQTDPNEYIFDILI